MDVSVHRERAVRGSDEKPGSLFSYVDLEARVRKDHPLRAIRKIVNTALERLSPDFQGLYSATGRPSIPPERLLRALLLQAFYGIRSERQILERLEFDLLFRWFVGLGVDDPAWDQSSFSKNRDRLLDGDIAAKLLADPKVKRLLSTEHFSVDGTLIEAWASMKSFRPKDGSGEPPGPGRNGERDFHGEQRTNDTHESATDPDARLFRKRQFRFLSRQLSLPVSMMSQWCVSRSSSAVVILGSANTEGHSAKARLVVTMIEVRS